ncbi:hypothetical protein HDU67_010042 [Dinochytrium kinnereticum]|nr:hypothetical protein HDU67_010042 [Dinochytrium kinnereticum]
MTHSPLNALLLQSLTEFLGMFIFIFCSLGAVQAGIATSVVPIPGNPELLILPDKGTVFYISCAFGLALATAVFITYRISGGALNPAVNFGLLVAGVMNVQTAAAYTVAQVAGATAACGTVKALFTGTFAGANALAKGTSPVQGIFMEAILTMGLVLTVLFLAVEKSKVTFMAPLQIGLYVFVAHLISIPYTNTSINPARSFGASAIAGEWKDHYIFWVGPCIGGAIAGLIYRFFKFVKYETLNPGQDAESVEKLV